LGALYHQGQIIVIPDFQMSSFELISHNHEETQEFGKRLGKIAKPGDVYLLTGKLGAGKTCLTQGIVYGLGITEYAASPTFVLMREMQGRLPLYHIDLYRLDNLDEIADLGLDDYFYSRGLCVVEWAEKGLNILPIEHLRILIDIAGENERRLTIISNSQRYEEILVQLKELSKD
jgi:tRNA threonylcarbamoyladenosine biosynthesis protein TsaE